MDIWVQRAREENRAAQQDEKSAGQHRANRDEAIRRLRADDPAQWTYAAIAKAVGIGPEMVAKICRADR